MRLAISLYPVVIAVALTISPARSQDIGWFKFYAVHIDRTPKQSWIGNGVYLGRGIVITAAHVAGLGFWRRPRVEIGGNELPTVVIKDGHFHGVDLTLLGVEERDLPVSIGLRRMPFCPKPSYDGEPVVVVTPEGATLSHVIPPALLPRNLSVEHRTAITYVAGSGTSGAGVFDANKKCLLGIITQKLTVNGIKQYNGAASKQRDVALYFEPVFEITDFMPSTVRP